MTPEDHQMTSESEDYASTESSTLYRPKEFE